MKQQFKLKRFLSFGLILPPLIPLAVAASCGSSGSDAPKSSELSQATIVNILKPLETSTNDAVNWPALPKITGVNELAFYYSNDATLNLAKIKQLPSTVWSKELPKTIDFNFDNRSLWARVTPATGYTIAETFIDLTASSKLKEVKSLIKSVAYENVDFVRVGITLSEDGQYVISDAVDLPSNTKLVFSISSKTDAQNLDKDALKLYLTTNYPNKPEGVTLPTIRVYLVSADATKYVLSGEKSADVTLILPLMNSLLNFVALEDSTNEKVHWPDLPKVSGIASYKFYSSLTSKTLDEIKALQTDDWSDKLPETVDYDFEKRSLWAQIVPEEGRTIAQPYVDLTSSSKIKEIKSVIPASVYASVDFSSVSVNVAENGSYDVADAVTLPDQLKLLFLIPSKSDKYLDKAALKKYLTETYPSSSGSVTLPPISVYLAPIDATKYVLKTEKRGDVTVIAAVNELAILNLKALEGSTNEKVLWSEIPSVPSVASYKFHISQTLETPDQIKDLQDGDWSSNPPETVDFDLARRFLWAKITPAEGRTVAEPYVNLTPSSKIKEIKSIVSANTYEAFDFSSIVFNILANGSYEINDNVQLPRYTNLLFSIPTKDVPPLDEIALQKYLTDNYPKDTLVSAFPAINAYLAPSDAAKYILKVDKHAPVRVVAQISTANLAKINSLKVQASSTNLSVQWPEIPSIPGVAALDFYSVSAASKPLSEIKELPSTAWIPNLPTELPADFELRSLWVRITPAAGYVLAEPYVEITTSSMIRAVKSVIPSSTYSAVDFSGVVIKTLENGDYEIVDAVADLPSNVKILFSIQSKNQPALDKVALQKYLTDNYPNNPTGSGLPVVNLYLIPTDETKYVLGESKSLVVSVNPAITRLAEISNADQGLINTMLYAEPTSVHNAINWHRVSGLSNQIQSLLYSVKNYLTLDDAKQSQSTDWVSDLPLSADFQHNLRHLWVKAVPGSKFLIDNPYLDITGKIQTILSLVDNNIEGFADFRLGSAVSAHMNAAADYTITEQNIPAYTSVIYKVSGQFDRNKDAFEAWIRSDMPSQAIIESTSIALVINEPTKYALGDNKQTKLFASALTEVDITDFLNTIVHDSSDSNNHNLVRWARGFNEEQTFTLPAGIKSVEFVVGDYATPEAAQGAYQLNKKTFLPSKIDFNYTKRFVWVFVKPLGEYKLINNKEVFDITTTSQIQAVKGRYEDDYFKKLAGVNAEAQSRLFVTGTLENPILDWAGNVNPDFTDAVTLNYGYYSTNHSGISGRGFLDLKSAMSSITREDLFDTVAKLNSATFDDLYLYVSFIPNDLVHYGTLSASAERAQFLFKLTS